MIIKTVSKIDAVINLYGTDKFSTADENGVVTWKDGHETTSEETTAINAKYEELLEEWTAQEYARNRKADYPDTGDQFNKIYDDGLTKWKSEMVDPVKTKWPKDNSGPVE